MMGPYTILVFGYCILCGCCYTRHHATALAAEQQQTVTDVLDTNDDWNVTVDERSINYFRNRLQIVKPNFIRFRVKFGGECNNKSYPGYTKETFDPYTWVWTYKSSRGLYPYMQWNMDYNILSFGLLDTKTLWQKSYILFRVKGNCNNITLGTNITTHRIAEQLMVLVSRLSEEDTTITEYQESYFCFLAEVPGFRSSLLYDVGFYLEYPISSIKYNCCKTYYDYSKFMYRYYCIPQQMNTWMICTTGPYFLGIILFLYFPILLFKSGAWLNKHEKDRSGETRELNENTPIIGSMTNSQNGPCEDANWVFLDGDAPKTFPNLFASLFSDNHPVLISRLKRFMFVLLGPTLVFIRIWVYHDHALEHTQELIARGVSVGFLAILGEVSTFQKNACVVLLTSYFVLGVLFLVIPRNVQNVIENGISGSSSSLSPLCLAAEDIRRMSQISPSGKPGYKNAANLFLCSFYMLFTTDFWKKLFDIQRTRFLEVLYFHSGFEYNCICIIILPLYILACFLEIALCIIYYTIPLYAFIVVIVRGAVKTISKGVRHSRHTTARNTVSFLLKGNLVLGILSFVVAVMLIFYVYTFCLVFIESFFFLSQILLFCYVAVLVYPAATFGSLFFGIILFYYMFRLVRGFGAMYLELLNDIVEVCIQIEDQNNYLHVYDGNLVISNANLTRLRSIKINDIILPVPQNILQRFQENTRKRNLLTVKNDTYGIRKDLFNYVIRKYLPVHQQVLKVAFHLAIVFVFLFKTINLTTKFVNSPTSEISDVLHVVFVVTVGALPRLLEVAMLDNSEHIQRAIRMRKLQGTINEYRRGLSSEDEDTAAYIHVHMHQELRQTSS